MKIQDYLDQLFVGLVPLVVTLLAFWLLRKKVNVNIVMFGIMFLGIILGLLGVC
jgi:PTS system mannose-specific IID component